MKCLHKEYHYSNVVRLEADIERDDVLVGFSVLGLPIYQTETTHMTFYGCTIHECNEKLTRELKRSKGVRGYDKYERALKYI